MSDAQPRRPDSPATPTSTPPADQPPSRVALIVTAALVLTVVLIIPLGTWSVFKLSKPNPQSSWSKLFKFFGDEPKATSDSN
ncbi:MAG: hypothetical protein ACKOUR_08375 [Planctomycetota bacterium]